MGSGLAGSTGEGEGGVGVGNRGSRPSHTHPSKHWGRFTSGLISKEAGSWLGGGRDPEIPGRGTQAKQPWRREGTGRWR